MSSELVREGALTDPRLPQHSSVSSLSPGSMDCI